MKLIFQALGFSLLCVLAFTSCKKDIDNPEDVGLSAEADELFSGGSLNTVFDVSANAFGFASEGLDSDEELQFFVGNSFFKQNWVSSPASTIARDGLGPVFNARSCSSCHLKDGRGQPPLTPNGFSNGFLVRLSIEGMGAHGGPNPHPVYGDQLNDQAIGGVDNEGNVEISYSALSGQFADEKSYELMQPFYALVNMNFGPADDAKISPRVGQQLIGLGLLEAISEEDILANVDELDSDGDGISGKQNMVWDEESQSYQLGRFGWKANQPSLKQQTAGAFIGDMGITSTLFPFENCTDFQPACNDAPNGGEPEISDTNLATVILYLSNLAVPARRNHQDQEVLKGKAVFNDLGCAGCHIPSFTTGVHDEFDNLSAQKIWPYTDLLLHDMGEDLADNRTDYNADGREWRTQPLWGLGLIETVNNHTFLLHDGRARTIEEAILWHGGEAEESKILYTELEKSKREQLLKFLKSL